MRSLKRTLLLNTLLSTKAERDPDYWSKFSGRVGNLYEGVVWKGHCIPARELLELKDEPIPF
jgi:hypothetical protein